MGQVTSVAQRTVLDNFSNERAGPSIGRIQGRVYSANKMHRVAPFYWQESNNVTPAKLMLPNLDRIPTIPNQLSTGTCTAQAVALAVWMLREFEASVMFTYYYARVDSAAKEGSSNITDSGVSVEDCLTSASTRGLLPDHFWPFDPSKVNLRPPADLDAVARQMRITSWHRLGPILLNIKRWLMTGKPVVMSFNIVSEADTWMNSRQHQENTGFMMLANTLTADNQIIGGHTVLIVGYDDFYLGRGALRVLNSWGSDWGDHGFFWIDYNAAFYNDLDTDYYGIESVSL